MKILVIFGPNLNMLGRRKKEIYGSFTLEELYEEISSNYDSIEFTFYQSNYEGEIIEVLHEAIDEPYDALIINPGGLTHTSVSIRDALEMIDYTKIEVHLSNILEREDFRKIDLIHDVCEKRFMGKKIESYFEAIDYILSKSIINPSHN
jgi:3-dehydroquinate dehydratase II